MDEWTGGGCTRSVPFVECPTPPSAWCTLVASSLGCELAYYCAIGDVEVAQDQYQSGRHPGMSDSMCGLLNGVGTQVTGLRLRSRLRVESPTAEMAAQRIFPGITVPTGVL